MLRITRIDDDPSAICLRIEGELVGESVAVLEDELTRAGAIVGGLTLDLAGVAFANRDAIDLLQRAAAAGARVTACPSFLTTFFRSEAL